jgi:hypothetical protein
MSDAALIPDTHVTSVVMSPKPATALMRERIVYLGTSHGTFVGTDANSNLIQIHLSNKHSGTTIRVKNDRSGNIIIPPMMSGFSVETTRDGISFVKDGKYLSAFPDSDTMAIANKELRKRWHTFQLVEQSKVPAFSLMANGPDVEMKRFRNVVSRLQAEGKAIKVNCGVGLRPLPGFLNLDIQCACPQFLMSNPAEFFKFPFVGKWNIPNDCVDYIFHEDFIEHILNWSRFNS